MRSVQYRRHPHVYLYEQLACRLPLAEVMALYRSPRHGHCLGCVNKRVWQAIRFGRYRGAHIDSMISCVSMQTIDATGRESCGRGRVGTVLDYL